MKTNRQTQTNLAINLVKRKSDPFQNRGGLEMKKEKDAKKPYLTDKDLVETLLLISETTKTLALEVMLLPKEEKSKGGKSHVKKSDDSQ